MLKFIIYSFVLAIGIDFSANAQKISSDERRILNVVGKHYEESVQFLETTVNVNSGTFNVEGVKKVGMMYKAQLDQLDFATKWIDMPVEMKRAGHLYAEIKGTKGKRLLLIGHLDTVFEPDSPVQTWIRKDTVAAGPGTFSAFYFSVQMSRALHLDWHINPLRGKV